MGAASVSHLEQVYPSVLVASSNDNFREQLQGRLERGSWSVEEARGGADALAKLDAGRHAALLVDVWLADLDVAELVRTVRRRCPQVEVLTVDPETGRPRRSSGAARSPRARDLFRLLVSPSEGLSDADLADSGAPGAANPRECAVDPLPGMIGTSTGIQQVYRLARLVAPRKTAALITGETGTGKELVARALHELSPRASRPFVIVNCAAIPEALLEAEMFGHIRGAFTGAVQTRLGMAHAAHNGTLFLDEIGEMPRSVQAKLLRFLQGGEVQRLGSTEVVRVDVRVIAATNANLEELVRAGRFRQDLYYRLSVFPIEIPALRERRDDIDDLAMNFLETLCGEAGVGVKHLGPVAARNLMDYHWPGNVRELQHRIERAFILSEDGPELLPEYFPAPVAAQ